MGRQRSSPLPWILSGRACVPRGMCSLWAARASGSLGQRRRGGGDVCAVEAQQRHRHGVQAGGGLKVGRGP